MSEYGTKQTHSRHQSFGGNPVHIGRHLDADGPALDMSARLPSTLQYGNTHLAGTVVDENGNVLEHETFRLNRITLRSFGSMSRGLTYAS